MRKVPIWKPRFVVTTEGVKQINSKSEVEAKPEPLNDGLCPVHIGVDIADGPDKTVYVCPVCHNEIKG